MAKSAHTNRIFVGRDDEKQAFAEWVAADAPPHRAALVVGRAGTGKSELLREFASMCEGRPKHEPTWFFHIQTLMQKSTAASFGESLIQDVYSEFKYRPMREGPRDEKGLLALLGTVPKALGLDVGDLLKAFALEDKRPGWKRLVDFLGAASDAMKDGERLVILVDPKLYLSDDEIDVWFELADQLPQNVRMVIAQRLRDEIAKHGEHSRHFGRIPAGELGDLPEERIKEWYETEFQSPRLRELGEKWGVDTRRALAQAAYDKYKGYAIAHETVIRRLSEEKPDDPVAHIQDWPKQIEDLLFDFYKQAVGDSAERTRMALVLPLLGTPVPVDLWAGSADVNPEELLAALRDPMFAAMLTQSEETVGETKYELHGPFHPLMLESLAKEAEKSAELRRRLLKTAMAKIDAMYTPELMDSAHVPRYLMTADEKVAVAESSPERLRSTAARLTTLLTRYGLLNELRSFLETMLELMRSVDRDFAGRSEIALAQVDVTQGNTRRAEATFRRTLQSFLDHDELVGAAFLMGELSDLLRMRGELSEAEQLSRREIHILRQHDPHQSLASAIGRLGSTMFLRGDLEDAEKTYREALSISSSSNAVEMTTTLYGNLGNVLAQRGDLVGATKLYRIALRFYRRQGNAAGMANMFGNLGIVMARSGNLQGAEKSFRTGIEIDERIGRLWAAAVSYGNLANVRADRGDPSGAKRLLWKALRIDLLLGMGEGVAVRNGNLGELERQLGNVARACAHWRAALTQFERMGMSHDVAKTKAILARYCEGVPVIPIQEPPGDGEDGAG